MIKGLSKFWSLITFLVIFVTGVFSTVYVVKDINTKSDIFGTASGEKTSYKIDDFNFQVDSLLFSETGNENEYLATATTLPISNFNKDKKYTLVVNDTLCNRVAGSYNFVQANFNNVFKDLYNNIIFDGSMQISIIPYKDYTKLIFLIGGENSQDYWSQYIVNFGLTITITEMNYVSQIEACNLPTKSVEFYFDNELYEIKEYNILNYSEVEFPNLINGIYITSWHDVNGIVYTGLTEKTIDNLKLYAQYDTTKLTLLANSETLTNNYVRDIGLSSTLHQSFIEFDLIDSDIQKNIFNNILAYESDTDKLKITLTDLDYDGIYNTSQISVCLDYCVLVSSNSKTLLYNSTPYTYEGYGIDHHFIFDYGLYVSIENDCLYYRLMFTVQDSNLYEIDELNVITLSEYNTVLSGFAEDSEIGIFTENFKIDIEILD